LKKTIQGAQERLKALGYDPGAADGVMGTKAIAALKRFQSDKDLPISGTLDRRTLDALSVKGASSPVQASPGAKAGSGKTEPSARKAAKGNVEAQFPDVLEGRLLLARAFSMNGMLDPLLWIKSDNAQYEIVLTEGTLVPPEWRHQGVDDERYPVGLNGSQFFVEPEGLQVTHNQDGTNRVTLNSSKSAGIDRNGHVMMLFPLIGRYSVRGRIDSDSGSIAASEVKYLGATP
jgi:peptidoglycan hydrolase-like protein with peptidoglycan-binding domain